MTINEGGSALWSAGRSPHPRPSGPTDLALELAPHPTPAPAVPSDLALKVLTPHPRSSGPADLALELRGDNPPDIQLFKKMSAVIYNLLLSVPLIFLS